MDEKHETETKVYQSLIGRNFEYWAEHQDQDSPIWKQFLASIAKHPDVIDFLSCYSLRQWGGNYKEGPDYQEYLRKGGEDNWEKWCDFRRLPTSTFPVVTCPECFRRFYLLDSTDSQEWSYGHDCEAPE